MQKNTDYSMFRQGFTLIEVSIVLVIIGLLAGGILYGQTLIRQSQINSMMSDVQNYAMAAATFSTKYSALPGDMANATNYWGYAGGDSGDNYTTSCYSSGSVSSAATCNGSGNGQVYESGTYANEQFRVWQHLANAQMILGNYTGVAGGGGASEHIIGTNCPASKIGTAGFGVRYVGVKSGDTNYFDGAYGHVLIAGGYSSTNPPVAASLTTVEAQSFDSKYDDGSPALGKILTWKASGYNANCATSSISSATYKTATSGQQCSMIFATGF